jgi:hypothetical protein
MENIKKIYTPEEYDVLDYNPLPFEFYVLFSKFLNIISFGMSNNDIPSKIIPSYWHWRFGLKYFILFIITMFLFINTIFIYKLNTYNTIYCNHKIMDDSNSKSEQHVFDPLLYYLGDSSFKGMIKNSYYGDLLPSSDGFTVINNDNYNLYKITSNMYLAIYYYVFNTIKYFLHINMNIVKFVNIINKIIINKIVG